MLTHIKKKNLNLYRTDESTFSKLLEVVIHYHDKGALIIVPEEQINRVETTKKNNIHPNEIPRPILQTQ